ncbi:MAG: DUF4349 domain-containing protein [Rickettsiales bacterium]|jgi:hypothetical protein|nr:DUF4349 domain-containing protein [Rickettsiales bacterium]
MFEKIKLFVLNNVLFLIVLFFLILFFGRGLEQGEHPVAVNPLRGVIREAPSAFEHYANNGDKVIKTYSLEMEVNNLDKTKDAINKKIKEFNGILNNFSSSNKTYLFSIRIPTELVDVFLINIKKLGNMKSERNTEDNFHGIYEKNEDRLKSLYSRRDRLKPMFKDAKNPIEVDRELSFVENDIMLIEKNNKDINDNIDFTRVNISISQPVSSDWKLINSWNGAVFNLIRFCEKSVDLSINLLLFSPIIVLIWFILKKTTKR